ncbi:TetR family transcriptional regulator C-terminal domain-containing protein [Nocardiopsis baichengensis]|uniref:TetR family transcriptional regulator C-terminal domain-containing protein n=1 Tax=Nocardiopsis baichengensis TaxID=280240 RepID=UPI00037D557E|nr:TetR family transcriptional regulator C-terminal domain-containing protein [Nocardiopsis baichengensis]
MTLLASPSVTDHMEGLRNRVREVIRRSGRPQREFASVMALEASKLSKSLSGTRRFTAEELIRIADIAGVTVNWLLYGEESADGGVAAAPRVAVATEPPVDAGRDVRAAREQGRRRQITDAAWRLIAERGYHSVRTADIAAECGVSSAAIHYHFPTLRELLDETLRSSVKQAFDRQVAVLHGIDDARERLRRLIELQLPAPGHLAREWSIWMQVWTESALDPQMRALHADSYQRWHDTIARTLRDGAASGAFRPDLDAEAMTVRLTALIDGLGIQVLTGRPGRTVERMRAALQDFVTTQIEPPGTGHRADGRPDDRTEQPHTSEDTP